MFNRTIYLNQLIKFKDREQVKVITGIRRCGKSTLLKLFANYLKKENIKSDNILEFNFEDLRYSNMTYLELNNLVESKLSNVKGMLYLFLDEVQRVEKWELAVNSLKLNKNIDIYITGSNAYLLSSEIATYLSGRYVEIKMQPLTFREFLHFYSFDTSKTLEEKFSLFLRYGGMPGLKDLNFDDEMINQTLDGILSTVLIKDIIAQSDVKDVNILRKITNYLADNIGSPISLDKVKNTLVSNRSLTKGVHLSAIDRYITLLGNAFLFYSVQRYDIKGKEYLKTQGKYYISDIGLRNFLLGFREIDRGHILENIVFLELLSRGYRVTIGKINDKEVDFIAIKYDEKIYIQVTESLQSNETSKREFAPLKTIKDSYKKIVLTMDKVFVNIDDDGIKVLNLIDWLIK